MESLISFIGDMASIGGAIFALLAWVKAKKIQENLDLERKRQNKKVTVSLHYGSKQLKLPVDLRRAELTRAEVLGRLGLIPMKKKARDFQLVI